MFGFCRIMPEAAEICRLPRFAGESAAARQSVKNRTLAEGKGAAFGG